MLILPERAQRPFVILALPRSRTAWLAHWLHGEAHPVGHDTLIECASVNDFLRGFEKGLRGSVETAAVEGWRRLRAELPTVRIVTVRRPLGEVRTSLAAFGLEADAELAKRDAALDEVEQAGAERIDFADLRQRGCRKWLWQHVLPEVPFDPARSDAFEGVNIQVDMPARVEQLRRRAPYATALREDLRNGPG